MSVRSTSVHKIGLLWVKQHTVKQLVKTWQLKYVSLRKRPEHEKQACLELYESQEAYNNCQHPKELMFNEIKYAGNWSSQSKEYAFIIIVSDQKQIYLAAKTKAERTEWLEAFNNFLHKPSNSCAQPSNDSTSSDHVSPTFAAKEPMSPTAVENKRQNFPVMFKDSTPNRELLNPKTAYLLQVSAKCITVLKDEPKESRKSVVTWLLATIRTYNSRPIEGRACKLLTIETGRQSSTGEGVFHFTTKYGDQIANQIRLNTSRSYLAKMNSIEMVGSSSPDTPRSSTSVPRPPGMPPRPSVKGHDHPGMQFQMYDEATETPSESFACYVRGENGYIHVLTPQEEVQKFQERKGSRPSIEFEPTFFEDNSTAYIEVLAEEPNDQSQEGMPLEPSSYDADHPTYIDVLPDDEEREGSFEGAEDHGKYVDVATMGSRDGEDEKKEYLTQFPMDGSEGSSPSSRGSPLSARGSPLSARNNSHYSRGGRSSGPWYSQTSQTSSLGFSSVSSDNDVFREKENTGLGDVFSEEHANACRRRISENDESESFEESRNSKTSSFHEGEDQILDNGIENEAIGNLENSQRKENPKTNSWHSGTESDHVETSETLGYSTNTSSGSETGTSARDSRELSDEVVSGGEMQRRRASSDTSSRRDSSGDSDREGTKEPRNRSNTMNDVMLMKGCSPQLLQDLLEKINTSQDVLHHNNHPQLSRLTSAFTEHDLIAQLENPTKVGVRGSSLPVIGTRAGEMKYICSDCGWYKWSKGRKSRSVLRKEKKCERCQKVIKRSEKESKKDRSNSIFDRFKGKLRSPSTTSDFEPNMTERPPLDTPQPSFVKQLHSRLLVHNPALDSRRGKLGIAPSLAHTAHAQAIGGEARTRSPSRSNLPNENLSPSARGTLSTSRSEGALGKDLVTVEKLPRTSGEKDKTLTRTISSPVCTAPTDSPLEFLVPEQGHDGIPHQRKLSGGNLPILPEVEDISEEPGSPCVENPPTIPPRTREEPPPIPPRRSSGVSVHKREFEVLRRAQTDPSSSTMNRGSPKLLEKHRLSRTMTDPGFNPSARNNNIRNAVSLGNLLEDESKSGCNLLTVVSLSLGEGVDPPPPLPPRKHSGPVQPPPLSPRRASNETHVKQNISCEPQRAGSPVSFESKRQIPENCSPERNGQKLPLTSKRSVEARKNFLSGNPIYHENVIESEDQNL